MVDLIKSRQRRGLWPEKWLVAMPVEKWVAASNASSKVVVSSNEESSAVGFVPQQTFGLLIMMMMMMTMTIRLMTMRRRM